MMRKALALLLIGVLASAGTVASAPRGGALAGTAALDVLFIGNSLLGTPAATGEDTPDVVGRLARYTGRTVRITKVVRFGSTLQQTWDAGPARRALTGSTRYDVIVLQEYSTLVATDTGRAAATLLRTYAPALPRSLKPGGRVVLFKNWALADPEPFPSRAAAKSAIDANYAALSAALHMPNVLAPIGDAFETVGAAHLIAPDGKHPNDTAIYLDAVTLYGVVTGASPRDLPDLYVDAATAAHLRAVAADILGR
jgi:hypothetical protein